MQTLATQRAERQPGRRPVAPLPLPDQLAAIARRIARLGYGARGPEDFVVEKLTLAAEVYALAREART